jgi:hypothetical protein
MRAPRRLGCSDTISISCAEDFKEAFRLLKQGKLSTPHLRLVLVDDLNQQEELKQEL